MNIFPSALMLTLANAWLDKMALTPENSEFIGVEPDPADPSKAVALFRRYRSDDAPVDFENAAGLDSRVTRHEYRRMNIADVPGIDGAYFDTKPLTAAELVGTYGNFTGSLEHGVEEGDFLEPVLGQGTVLVQVSPTSLLWYGQLTLVENWNYVNGGGTSNEF